MNSTSAQYDHILKQCKDIFTKKMLDYGSAWRVLRNPSIVDQIFIKTQRIRTIDEKGAQRVNESLYSDYIGIVNYSIIGLVQRELKDDTRQNISEAETSLLFDKFSREAKLLMENKNHDYGEAWKEMKLSSFTDLILMKLIRIRQIDEHGEKLVASEGIDANYLDVINYAVFALIKMQ